MMEKAEKALIWIGGGALLLAAVVEGIAVISRHIGVPFLGSIEYVQALVLFASASALVIATATGKHAVVHLVKDRLSGKARSIIEHFGALLSALFTGFLLIGSVWVASDMWDAFEESELMGVPYKPLRLFAILALIAVTVLFIKSGFKKEDAE